MMMQIRRLLLEVHNLILIHWAMKNEIVRAMNLFRLNDDCPATLSFS